MIPEAAVVCPKCGWTERHYVSGWSGVGSYSCEVAK